MTDSRTRALASAFPQGHQWPVSLSWGPVSLRPLRWRDNNAWFEVRERNRQWLQPWEATWPRRGTVKSQNFRQMVSGLQRNARDGAQVPWALWYDDGRGPVFAGQVNINGIVYGSANLASIGYWIDSRWAGRGVMPAAVALATDYALSVIGLHRIEVCIRPENTKSLRVAEKLALREEGLRSRFLHIDGDWRDHRVFVAESDESKDGLMSRVKMAHSDGDFSDTPTRISGHFF